MISNNEFEKFCHLRREMLASFGRIVRSGAIPVEDLRAEAKATNNGLFGTIDLEWTGDAR